jgi:hypothetical protein
MSPEGTAEFSRAVEIAREPQPSLRDFITFARAPNVETLGYYRMSLRDKGFCLIPCAQIILALAWKGRISVPLSQRRLGSFVACVGGARVMGTKRTGSTDCRSSLAPRLFRMTSSWSHPEPTGMIMRPLSLSWSISG